MIVRAFLDLRRELWPCFDARFDPWLDERFFFLWDRPCDEPRRRALSGVPVPDEPLLEEPSWCWPAAPARAVERRAVLSPPLAESAAELPSFGLWLRDESPDEPLGSCDEVPECVVDCGRFDDELPSPEALSSGLRLRDDRSCDELPDRDPGMFDDELPSAEPLSSALPRLPESPESPLNDPLRWWEGLALRCLEGLAAPRGPREESPPEPLSPGLRLPCESLPDEPLGPCDADMGWFDDDV